MNRTQTPKKSRWLYVLAAAYVVSAYTFLFLPGLIGGAVGEIAGFLPLFLAALNLIVVCSVKNKVTRTQLLNCTILIKCSLIPFYLVGGAMILLSLLMTLIPVPFMIFVGPTMAFTMGLWGWIILVGAAPFSIAYLVKAHQEGVHGKFLTIPAGIFQFFFTLDVLSIMILAFKEKRWRKLTITVLVLLLLLAAAGVVSIGVLIGKALLR